MLTPALLINPLIRQTNSAENKLTAVRGSSNKNRLRTRSFLSPVTVYLSPLCD
jgi:hypothetical protein